ncbi:hypothetical protein D0Z07_3048 [Hyphodiscus hymeniophilus]|uniref:Uncharacterized protein n=1 Tax=Hyphodiscus hymeniophilus TaxID=353542 RepID=A0A9P7AYS9_9HELO|nr:hypothetical protein D0Z07_3048 [Hyphodiscus hymeniophilus]
MSLDSEPVRMQTSLLRQGMIQTLWSVIKTDGPLGFYKGTSWGQANWKVLYGTTRFAIYETTKTKYTSKAQAKPSVIVNIGAASLAGFAGGVVGNPADLANVRMQGDSALAADARRNYKNVLDACWRFGEEEGWRGYTRGVWTNASRASIMTASQLASYDGFKTVLIEEARVGDNLGTHFAASVLAGLVATTVSSPIDVMKSQIMSLPSRTSAFKVARALWQTEGFRWLFRGWIPSFMRTGPHTIATFVFLEQQRKVYRQLYFPEM